jgi:WhiB family redox-sensing transcriptional regulator
VIDPHDTGTGDWIERALCAQAPGDLWFPNMHTSRHDYDLAKRTCAICPVREDCLEYVLDNNEREGIWAGLTYHERRAIKADRADKEAA